MLPMYVGMCAVTFSFFFSNTNFEKKTNSSRPDKTFKTYIDTNRNKLLNNKH